MVKRPAEYRSREGKLVNGDDEIMDKVRVKPGELPSKKFEARNSFLTDLYEIKHIRTIYHICLAMLFGLFLNTAAHDYLYEGKIRLGLSLMSKGFARFHIVLAIWVCMFLATIAVYFGFKLWATVRVQLKPKSFPLILWDRFCLGLFILFYPSFMYLSTVAVTETELPIAGSIAVLCEMTRLLMKTHAFVRSNAPRVLRYKLHTENQVLCPDVKKFLYFSFVPTAVYQDNYPRSSHIQWNYVGVCLLEFVGAIFFYSFLLERFLIPSYKDYGLRPYSWRNITVLTLDNVIPSMFIMLNTFYTVLHAWQNMFAEVLRFSDRMFYKDWWTSANHERYYRTWNVTVHDWLYTYIYKDFYENCIRSKFVAKYMVFFASAVFHDYILGFAFRFWLPILFVQFFGAGVVVSFMKIKPDSVGNIFLWYSSALGMSFNTAGYAIEYYARVNCPIENVTFSSYFTPHFLACGK